MKKLRRNIRSNLVTKLRDDLIVSLRTDLSSILLNVKAKKKKTLIRYLRLLLQISALNLILTNYNLRLPTSRPLETSHLIKPLLLILS